MRLEKVGNSDLVVSRVGLGCNNFGARLDLEWTRAGVEAAPQTGINHFHTGVSNFSAAQLEEAAATAPVAAIQNEYSLLDREVEEEVLPRARELGVGFVPYFPLASGLLTGKYRRGQPWPKGARLEGREDRYDDETFDRIEALEEFANACGRTPL